ncbi:putative manganese efflux pump MntP [Litchfieldella qijiaojingensis]|uniref:Putative manganese efflux pump MntP n=1 Tax=Litchfieldella qijiaojingensis TaxID=980347 RepID=A0ABQ2Z101_9GAMM|nr:manganese efflux pump MntP [Halomonas qijiaojingensis]GGY01534.1 putative manganese efflux pump MntP [Halomonas qijiaojingensis]
MTPLTTLLLAFSMSADAFAASIGKGAMIEQPRFREALRTGLIFGTVEALTPLLGWALGVAAAHHVEAWDHWIVFTLLLIIGGHMIVASFSVEHEESERPRRRTWWLLAATAVATSIDALAVGIGLAFLDINILVTALAIGMVTTLMATLGTLLGRHLGELIGRRAELLGGLILIGIGSGILTEHLGMW